MPCARRLVRLTTLLMLLSGVVVGCGKRSASEPPPAAERMASGKELARIFCGTCHLVPDPAAHPSDRWGYVVDWMGHYLGHEVFQDERDRITLMTSLIPLTPTVTAEQLADIKYYYLHASGPEIAPDQVFAKPLQTANAQFRPTRLLDVPTRILISCVRVDEQRKVVYLGNGSAHRIQEHSLSGSLLAIHPCRGTQPAGIILTKNGFVAPLIGDLFNRVDNGAVMVAKRAADGSYGYTFPVRNYFRTAHCEVADINGDGRDDYLVAGFGTADFGAFSVFTTTADGATVRQDLLNVPGTLESHVHDFDGDGDLDIMALTTQGHHDLWLFINDGTGRFEAEHIWKKQPSFGANSFRLVDFEGDGTMEIVVATGNNIEIPFPPVRPYHGIYVFRDVGQMNYQQVYFHRLPGAIAFDIADFNADGRLDIAAVSSVPDWRIPNPIATLLLENVGNDEFEAFTLPATRGTSWVCIEAGDIDGDGDPDLLLGQFPFSPDVSAENKQRILEATRDQPCLLVLENLN